MSALHEPELTCSFCGKAAAEVEKLVAGPGVFICDECVELCNQIIDDTLEPDVESMLRRLRSSTEEMDELVEQLKAAGVSWDRIAQALRGDLGDDDPDDDA